MPANKTAGPARKKAGSHEYGKKAGEKVERVMHEFKEGTLRSGKSGPKVRSRKQAVAIGLSEARQSGAKVPPSKTEPAPKRRTRRNIT